MMGRTHMAFGLLVGLALFTIFKQEWYIFVPVVVFASLLSDMDHENSKINKMVPITRWVPKLFKHRGFFHSIFPVAAIYFGLHYLNLDVIGIPLAIGYLAHLGSDCLTVMGVNLIYPIGTLRVQGSVRTDGWMEHVTLGIVLCLNAFIVYKRFF